MNEQSRLIPKEVEVHYLGTRESERLSGVNGELERLRTLEGAGFIFRHYEQTIPPAVTYGITARMKDIEKVLAQLDSLSRKWQGEGKSESTHDVERSVHA